jgi:hypothetical protein
MFNPINMTDELIDYETSDLKLSPIEEDIFVTSEKKCKVMKYENQNIVVFPEDKMRTYYVQIYLAHYIRYIESKIRLSDKPFVYIEFQNDQHIAVAASVPQKYSSCLSIIEDINQFRKDYPKLSDNCDNFKEKDNMISLMIRINQINLTHTYNINTFQIYSNVIIRQELYDDRVVYLTPLQRDLLLATETKVTFYSHQGYLEPLILEDDLRNSLIKLSIYFMLERDKIGDGKIHTLHFRNGDRDLVNLANAVPIDRDYYNMGKLSDYKNDKFYEEIEKAYNNLVSNNDIIFILYFYKPKTDEVILSSWISINKKDMLESGIDDEK